jgi:hypothetical protein
MRRPGSFVVTCYLAASMLALLVSAGSVLAQSGPGGPSPGGPRRFAPGAFGPGGRGFGFGVEGCLNSGKVVVGQGYTGTLAYESVKPVLNGAPIDHTTTETIARDNDGRTQLDITLPPFPNAPQGSPRQVICINDPVAGFGYVLDPANMTARQFKLHQGKPKPGNIQGGAGQIQPPGPGDSLRPPKGPNPNVTTVTLNASSAPAGIQSECPGVTGTQKTRTVTIPGNNGQAPSIQIVTTRWYCPAFSMNLQTQTSDPLQGISTRTITITGGGPAAISVPTGYKIITAGTGGFGSRSGAPTPPQP